MPSVRQIRRRIRSVENTSKITRAMSLIAASKMRRSQESAENARPYSDLISNTVSKIISHSSVHDAEAHPLTVSRDMNKITLIHITPDRGLTGGLNGNVNRNAFQFIEENKSSEISVIGIGRKGIDFLSKTPAKISESITDISDRPEISDFSYIAEIIVNDFINKKTDAAFISYSSFVNTTTQNPTINQLLPVPETSEGKTNSFGYIFEPNINSVISELIPKYLKSLIFHCILESIASEQSARMVAMRNATDSANEMVEDLTLVMNKARQEAITTELLDIVSGVAAVQ